MASQNGKEGQESLLELTNEITELVYVADTETYELLFINNAGKEQFGQSCMEGEKCYRVLQGLDAPCPFCTNSKLNLHDTYTWEVDNPITKGHYLLRDKLIPWKGKMARMEIAFDITRQENERVALNRALDAEHVLLDCVRMLYDQANMEDAMYHTLQRVGEFFAADRTSLITVDKNGTDYHVLEWRAKGVPAANPRLREKPDAYLRRWSERFAWQPCIVVEDIEELRERLPEEYRLLTERGVHSTVAVPLEREEGELGGYISVDNPNLTHMQNIEPLFQTLRYFIMAAYRRSENEERLLRLSYHDMLTGLYNRNRFSLDTREASVLENMGVVQLNINGLKTINDKQGHATGDNVLAQCAQYMRDSFNDAEFYRIGGDEFVILCRNVPRERFDADVRRLRSKLVVNGTCSAAIGAEWAEHTSDLRLLLSEAAEQMYNDKRRFYRMTLSSDRYRYYNDDVLGLTEPGVLQQELDKGSFLVYFQPKVSFEDRGLSGAEALVRYRMEDGTIVPPQQFVPLLEDAHLLSAVDFFVLETVCAHIASWRESGYRAVPVAVNFSRYSLTEEDFLNHLTTCCQKYGVDGKQLEIEITESVEGMEGFNVKNCLAEIRNAGFAVSIDDFGARYANMYLFATTRFDVLKIDKSLVDDVAVNENVLIMLESLNDFCKKLHIETVAEGVETEEQFQLLKSIGLGQAQGYLFSRPIPAEVYEQNYLAVPACR